MNPKNILIVYASFAGATAEIAGSIKKTLTKQNYNVVLMPAEGIKTDLTRYDFVILGAAFRGDVPHQKIKEFILANHQELQKKKIAVFAVCITITSVKENRRIHAFTYPDKISDGLAPISKVVFAGIANSSGWFGNLMGKKILGITPGDFRDWNKINDWTLTLPELIENLNA